MGFFDKLLSNREDIKPGYAEAAMMLLPIVGPFAAAANMGRKRKKALSEQETIYDYVDNDPLSQRVAQRMLMRTGEETIPGIMAHTTLSQEAKTAPRMANAFDSAAQRMMAAGQVEAGGTLGAYGNKAYGAPIKPEEAAIKPLNFTKGNRTVSVMPNDKDKMVALVNEGYKYTGVADQNKVYKPMSGAEIGFKGPAANNDFLVAQDEEGNIIGAQNADDVPKISVGGASIYQPADLKEPLQTFGLAYKATDDFVNNIDKLDALIASNPTGGVQGWSGVITGIVGKVSNLADFVSGLGAEEKALVDKYTGGILANARKLFPTADRAEAEALTIQLAYSLARMNNMGTAGGGRGITDADMNFALKQLGQMEVPADMRRVLATLRNQAIDRFDTEYTVLDAQFQTAGQPIPQAFQTLRQKMQSKKDPTAPVAGQEAPPAAIEHLRRNPHLKEDFKKKYGYIPNGI